MVAYIKSDLEFILKQIKIAETHAAGQPLYGPGGLIPTYNLSWGLRTVDGTYNNLLHPEWGAADNEFPEPLGTQFRTIMVDPDGPGPAPLVPVSYTPGVDNDGPMGTAGPSDVFDPYVRTISNLLVDQTLGNPAAILTALQRAGIVDPANLMAVTDNITAAYAPLVDEFKAVNDAERADAEAQAAASASPGNQVLQAAATLTAANLASARAALDAVNDDLTTWLDATGIELDGSNIVITNAAPDEGLSAPFNSWFTLFGQFFDHGLDLVAKGGNGTVFIPLMPDDPLYDPNSPTNFMVLTRATLAGPGADGVMGTGDDTDRPVNTTTSFVDQNQTYTSHSSHQVFLRQYELRDVDPTAAEDFRPFATGKLIEGSNGGMATWADVKAQAREMLGIDLTDFHVGNLPLLATDQYGNFIPDPDTGFPQVVMAGPPQTLASGTPDAPLNLISFVADGNDPDLLPDVVHLAVRTGHAFLADIAHNAVPTGLQDGDITIGLENPGNEPGIYDNELLDAHFVAGDGRANENIGLTAVHHVFHSEHNRLVEHTKEVVLADASAMLVAGATQTEATAFLNEWLVDDVATVPATAAGLVWDGERLFQAAKFGTEMQYQHLVFEEFARKIQPNINVFLVPDGYDVTIDPSIVAEFAHVVYRFGHSMLTETIDRFDEGFNPDHIGLIEGFLNPLQFQNNGTNATVDADVAAGDIIRGMTRQAGNEIDEFVTSALRNNLLGLPLDLATINLARGRDTGVPTLNEARRQFYEATNHDSLLKPYESWVDFAGHLKHEASIINFIAAYGTHSTITSQSSIEGKRDAAFALVLGGNGAPADRLDFLNATGAYATAALGGLSNVDLWIGGLAEQIMPFGGMLGSTFNFVFEMQMEKLQSGDRFYYLQRLDGLHLFGEMENNSFAAMIERNTDAKHLPSDVFSTPGLILEVDKTKQYNSDTGVFVPEVAPGQTWTPPSTAALAALLAAREDGSPLVDDMFYNSLNPDVAAAGVDPDVHYAQFGRQEGRQPNHFFDVVYYATQNPDVTGNFLDHYATFGWKEGRNPSAQFDGARYLAENPDVAAAGMDPLAHFLQFGRYEGRHYYPIGNPAGQTWTTAALEDGSPLVDDVFYNLQNPDVAAAGVDPDVHYAQFGRQEGRLPNQFFNAAFYAAQNFGFAGNLLEHYLTSGWTEGKNPSAQFDGARYLAENPDVAAAGMNPLSHFLQFGRHEGRQYYPVSSDVFVVDTNADPIGSGLLTQLVIRDNPSTAGPDSNYLRYTGGDHVVLGGTDPGNLSNPSGNDILISGIGDDTLYGDGGNDLLEGGFGNDIINAGDGDDIITDIGGDDNIKAGKGNDVVHAGPGLDLVMGNDGQDFIFLGTDMGSEVFAGTGNDFIYGNKNAERILGNEGNDWIETGTFDGAPGDNFDEIFSHDDIDGHDVFLGDGGFDEFIGEGGDDIMVGSPGRGKMVGMSGYDWATYKDNTFGVNADLSIPIIFDEAPTLPQNASLDEFESVEGLSGTRFNDVLKGSNTLAAERLPAAQGGSEGYRGSQLTKESLQLISGLAQVLGLTIEQVNAMAAGTVVFSAGDIILGGDGNDLIQGNAGDDIIDGDKWLNVRIAVHQSVDPATGLPTGPIIAYHNSMTTLAPSMFNGTINPGQLEIVREITTAGDATPDVDTAAFSDDLQNYAFGTNANGSITVSHTIVSDGLESDGTDTLTGIERLQFRNASLGVIVGTPGNDTVTGTAGNDLLLGFGGDDTLNGFGGDDILVGGAGNDTLNGGLGNDTYIYNPGDGNDIIHEPVDATSGGTADRLSIVSTTIDPLTLLPVLSGLNAQDNNTNTANGSLVINANGGTITVNGHYTGNAAGTGIELINFNNATYEGYALGADDYLISRADPAGPFFGLGPRTVNLSASLANNMIVGENGTDDVITGGVANDLIFGGTGDNDLIGGDGDDLLVGGSGGGDNDLLDGGLGADTMVGLAGNDVYVVDDLADVVVEALNAGTDRVESDVDYTLSGEVENLNLNGTAVIGRGNSLNNIINGNDATNQLFGGGGIDTLNSGAGDDLIDGGEGNDNINGGDDNDTIIGGNGNDTINVTDGNDVLRYTAAGFGADIVNNFDSVGGSIANQDMIDLSALGITNGNFATRVSIADIEDGAVDDTLITVYDANGIAGGVALGTIRLEEVEATGGVTVADFILAGAAPAVLAGATAGNDTLTGTAAANTINALAGDDTVNAGAGNDIINGGLGNDTLNGDDGDDTFNWNANAVAPTDGRDIVNGGTEGAAGDTFAITGNASNETYRIYTRTAFLAANPAAVLVAATEIVVTRDGTDAASIIAELSEIEEIRINSADPSGNGTAGGDTFQVIGDFSGTSLRLNTITIDGEAGDDTIDISALSSAHRIVFRSNGGHDTIIGTLREQDVIELPEGTTLADYEVTIDDETGMTTLVGDDYSVTFSTSGGMPQVGTDDGNVDDDNDGEVTPPSLGSTVGGTAVADVLLGTEGVDTIRALGDDDLIDGLGGRDLLFGDAGDDVILGGGGDDLMYGDAGADRLFGGDGRDLINAGSGDDTVYGDAGDDIFMTASGDGNDTYYGDDGSDTLDMSTIGANVTVDLGTGFMMGGSAFSSLTGSDTLWGVENVVTGSGNDTITASSAVNIMDGRGGSDTFRFQSTADADGDTIVGFQPGDKLDLSTIDSNSGTSGNQSFTLVTGSGFTGAGQLLVTQETRADGEYTVVEGNTSGDDTAEFRVSIKGVHDLSTTDFNL